MPRTPGLSRFVRRVKEGEADLNAGRVSGTTALLTRSRANLRRLRAAHAEIEAEIARRRIERYTAKRVREFDRAEAALGKALRQAKRRAR